MTTPPLSHADSACLEESLLEWGGEDDPSADDFRRGWIDQRRGIVDPPCRTTRMAEHAAYYSGSIAARETPLPSSGRDVRLPPISADSPIPS